MILSGLKTCQSCRPAISGLTRTQAPVMGRVHQTHAEHLSMHSLAFTVCTQIFDVHFWQFERVSRQEKAKKLNGTQRVNNQASFCGASVGQQQARNCRMMSTWLRTPGSCASDMSLDGSTGPYRERQMGISTMILSALRNWVNSCSISPGTRHFSLRSCL